jgi:hypothetical protein
MVIAEGAEDQRNGQQGERQGPAAAGQSEGEQAVLALLISAAVAGDAPTWAEIVARYSGLVRTTVSAAGGRHPSRSRPHGVERGWAPGADGGEVEPLAAGAGGFLGDADRPRLRRERVPAVQHESGGEQQRGERDQHEGADPALLTTRHSVNGKRRRARLRCRIGTGTPMTGRCHLAGSGIGDAAASRRRARGVGLGRNGENDAVIGTASRAYMLTPNGQQYSPGRTPTWPCHTMAPLRVSV